MQTLIDLLKTKDEKLHLNDYHIHMYKYAIDRACGKFLLPPILDVIIEYIIDLLQTPFTITRDSCKNQFRNVVDDFYVLQQNEHKLRIAHTMKYDIFGHFGTFLKSSKPNEYKERCSRCKEKCLPNCTHRIGCDVLIEAVVLFKGSWKRRYYAKIFDVIGCKMQVYPFREYVYGRPGQPIVTFGVILQDGS
jgi:hypothetical protein